MSKLIIYTCITNDYDWLLPPIWRSSNVQYICFTDNTQVKSKGWELRPIPSLPSLTNGIFANRYCKFFPWEVLPVHDISIYIDANIRVLSDPRPIIMSLQQSGHEWAIPKHPARSDLWQEADACESRNKLNAEEMYLLRRQLISYESEGLPRHCGLTENNIIIRFGNRASLEPVMRLWWDEFMNGVKRDQISLPYVLWKTETNVFQLPFNSRDRNPYFRIVPHRKGSGNGIRRYLAARKYHGLFWKSVFRTYGLISGVVRRLRNLSSSLVKYDHL